LHCLTPHMQADVLVIGGGAAGLIAASELATHGKRVIVLEARNRLGGRIDTRKDENFTFGAELGAEFIHGQLPVTLDLLKEAGITYTSAVGDMWRYNSRGFYQDNQFIANYDELEDKLKSLQEDLSINSFLERYFSDEKYTDLRNSLRSFAAGYDTANADDASTFALRDELLSEDDNHQYRVEGGYAAMISYLENQITAKLGAIYLNAVAKQVTWQPGQVTVTTAENDSYQAACAVIALPLGVLNAHYSAKAAINFAPPITEQTHAFSQMGYGAVVKILLQFTEIFWDRQAMVQGADESVENMGYLFTEQPIPTWWTQNPDQNPLLTGWIGGPEAALLTNVSDDAILAMALQSLSTIFKVSEVDLNAKLTTAKVVNWTADPFSLGSYSYATVASKQAREKVTQPIESTIYFAGEALFTGPQIGTVEAALASGKLVAGSIINKTLLTQV
jgi:monoamine oxidase